jgi:hypothetical protein
MTSHGLAAMRSYDAHGWKASIQRQASEKAVRVLSAIGEIQEKQFE